METIGIVQVLISPATSSSSCCYCLFRLFRSLFAPNRTGQGYVTWLFKREFTTNPFPLLIIQLCHLDPYSLSFWSQSFKRHTCAPFLVNNEAFFKSDDVMFCLWSDSFSFYQICCTLLLQTRKIFFLDAATTLPPLAYNLPGKVNKYWIRYSHFREIESTFGSDLNARPLFFLVEVNSSNGSAAVKLSLLFTREIMDLAKSFFTKSAVLHRT